MFAVEQGFITEEEATAIKAVEVREYGFRAGTLKRAPKAGFYRNDKVTYSWGQHTSEHEREEKFPSWMLGGQLVYHQRCFGCFGTC